MTAGIYWRPAPDGDGTEVVTVEAGGEAPSGAGWRQLDPRTELGLIAVRGLLIERGIVTAERAPEIYWHIVRRRLPDGGAAGAAGAAEARRSVA